MKRYILLAAYITFSAAIYAQKNTFTEAVKYNDFIVGQQIEIGKAMNAFTDLFGNGTDTAALHSKRREVVAQADKSYKILLNTTPYEGDTSLIKHAKALFLFYSKIAANEYKQIVDLLYDKTKSSEDVTKALGSISDSVTQIEKTLDINFATAQKAFAEKYNFDLKENDFKMNQ